MNRHDNDGLCEKRVAIRHFFDQEMKKQYSPHLEGPEGMYCVAAPEPLPMPGTCTRWTMAKPETEPSCPSGMRGKRISTLSVSSGVCNETILIPWDVVDEVSA